MRHRIGGHPSGCLRRGRRCVRRRAGGRGREAEGHRVHRPAADTSCCHLELPGHHADTGGRLCHAGHRLLRQVRSELRGRKEASRADRRQEPSQRLAQPQGPLPAGDHPGAGHQRPHDRLSAGPVRLLRGERRGGGRRDLPGRPGQEVQAGSHLHQGRHHLPERARGLDEPGLRPGSRGGDLSRRHGRLQGSRHQGPAQGDQHRRGARLLLHHRTHHHGRPAVQPPGPGT